MSLPFSFYDLYAQLDSIDSNFEDVVNEVLQESILESDNEDTYQIIEDLLQNPIDINYSTISDFQKIPGLTVFYSKLLINHRERFGSFFSLSELGLVDGLPSELIEKIKPFLTITSVEKINATPQNGTSTATWDVIKENFQFNYRSRIINDLQQRRGFAERRFEGSKPKLYNRLLIKYGGSAEAGFVTEKDAGENSWNEHTSFHLAFRKYGIVKILSVGDYTLEFGQGLALWSPYALSKSADVIYPLKRKNTIIKPYKGTNENNFFRGAAVSLQLGDFIFSTFYSKNYFDANIDSSSNLILSTPLDGFHRTESEKKKRKSAVETFYGARFDFMLSDDIINAGFLYYQSKFSNAFTPAAAFDLAVDKFNFTSFYYDLHLGKINLFGESAFDGRSLASIANASFSFGRNFAFIVSVRSYPHNFRSVHSYAFGENSGSTKNEVGIYSGFQLNTWLGEINFYIDQFKFPAATFENSLPSSGSEILINLRSRPFHKTETILRYKYEKKEVTEDIGNLKTVVPRIRQLIRGEVIYNLSKKLRLKTRAEFNNFQISEINIDETGIMIFQDVRLLLLKNLSLESRFAAFQTKSFNSAIYEYESDLAGILSNVALYGSGVRWYLLVKYKPITNISFAMKYAETYKPMEKNLGSGLSEILNNVDNKISLHIEVNL